MTLVADYAWARPGGATLKAAGFDGVMRYASYTNGHRLDAIDLADLHAHGLKVGVVWETTADRALVSGYGGGVADARAGNAQMDALGFPLGRPLYFAVDQSASFAQVEQYASGFYNASKRPVGPYGDFLVVSGAIDAGYRWTWQTIAWSSGVRDRRSQLWQRNWIETGISGIDENEVQALDWGGWHPLDAPAPTTIVTKPKYTEDSMTLVVIPTQFGPAVRTAWGVQGHAIVASFSGGINEYGVPIDASNWRAASGGDNIPIVFLCGPTDHYVVDSLKHASDRAMA